MSNDLVRYEARPPAVVVTINRPDRRNALSRALIAALTDAFNRARDDAAAIEPVHVLDGQPERLVLFLFPLSEPDRTPGSAQALRAPERPQAPS